MILKRLKSFIQEKIWKLYQYQKILKFTIVESLRRFRNLTKINKQYSNPT